MGRGVAAAPHASAAWLLSGLLLALAAPAGGLRVAPECPGPHAWLREVPGGRVTARICASSTVPPLLAGRLAEGILFAEPLDPNLASAKSLEALPGIGARRAMALVRWRKEARFRLTADLLRVPGIGPRTLERVRPFVRVNDSTADLDGEGAHR